MIEILITIDYEVFEAQVNPKRDLVSKTDKILKVCDKYDVKITIMMEALQYKAFKKFDKDLIAALGYSPAYLIEEQIKKAYCNGHDVQLHLHPQWKRAEYSEGKWFLDRGLKDLTTFNTEYLREIIIEGKDILEKLIKTVDNEYRCRALRFQGPEHFAPDKKISSLLSENGFMVHSLADYCLNEKSGYWPLLENKKIYEIPIFSLDRPKLSALSFLKIMTMLYTFRYDLGALAKKINDKIFHKNKQKDISVTEQTYRQKFDFCKLSNREMDVFLKEAYKQYGYLNQAVPVVMTGHPKDFIYSGYFERWLNNIARSIINDPKIRYNTFSRFIDEFIEI
jgi:hypothetical protein